MSTIPVVAVIRAKAGKEKELEGLLKALVPPTHAETGCARYALHKSQADPRVFVFIEGWKSPEALNAHLGSSHIAAAMSKKEELIETIDIMPLALIPVRRKIIYGKLLNYPLQLWNPTKI